MGFLFSFNEDFIDKKVHSCIEKYIPLTLFLFPLHIKKRKKSCESPLYPKPVTSHKYKCKIFLRDRDKLQGSPL